MSANNAEPAGEVKNPDEPISGQNGVDYDSYASGGDTAKSDSKDINFDSQDIKKRQKTEYFVNVEGAEKIKREEERRETEMTKQRIKNLRKVERKKYSNTERKNGADKTTKISQKIRTRAFVRTNTTKIIISISAIAASVAIMVLVASAIIGGIRETNKSESIAADTSEKTENIEDIRRKYPAESDEYFNAMQDIIDSAEYDEAKAYFLLMRAEDLYNCGDPECIDKAKVDAYKSEELDPTIGSAGWISVIEDKIGNSDKANEYGQKQSERMQSLSEGSDGQG